MPTQPYKNKTGERVPGVTTIIGARKDCGGLIHWAWDLGMKGLDYRKVRDTAAGIGTIAHDLVECWIRKTEFDESKHDPEMIAKAKVSFQAFLDWADSFKLKIGETEIPLVSEKYQYGGTMDALFVKNKRVMADWKTSGSIYPEYLIQIAAYKNLWEENYPDKPIEDGGYIVRFDKEYGDFHYHHFTDLDVAWEAFKHLRAVYDLDKILKKRVR